VIRVKLLPGGVLHIGAIGLTIHPGQEVLLPRETVDRHAGRFVVLEPDDEPPAPETTEPVDVSAFHTGGGWYEGPAWDGKVRRAEAELHLRSHDPG
jgi:hypothetical protein